MIRRNPFRLTLHLILANPETIPPNPVRTRGTIPALGSSRQQDPDVKQAGALPAVSGGAGVVVLIQVVEAIKRFGLPA